jgi:hypothetical protein
MATDPWGNSLMSSLQRLPLLLLLPFFAQPKRPFGPNAHGGYGGGILVGRHVVHQQDLVRSDARSRTRTLVSKSTISPILYLLQ